MADPRLRQLTIKTGVVKRLTKEKSVYEKEADAQRLRIERLKSQGQDEHVLKKEEEVLQECLMMVPDCQRRLKKAYEELKEFLNTEEELKTTKEYTTAVTIVEDAVAALA